MYSKALKTGEWVRINETEGEVLEVGLLAAKIRTIEGKEVTVPNSVLVGTSTVNFTRLGHPDGMIVSSTLTIGYDAPWRQVHALLELAADRTDNLRKSPKPYVLQRQLSDFYVEYTPRCPPKGRETSYRNGFPSTRCHPGFVQRVWRADHVSTPHAAAKREHNRPSREVAFTTSVTHC